MIKLNPPEHKILYDQSTWPCNFIREIYEKTIDFEITPVMLRKFNKILLALNKEDQNIISLRFRRRYSYQMIGNSLKITRQAAHAKTQKILDYLRCPPVRNQIFELTRSDIEEYERETLDRIALKEKHLKEYEQQLAHERECLEDIREELRKELRSAARNLAMAEKDELKKEAISPAVMKCRLDSPIIEDNKQIDAIGLPKRISNYLHRQNFHSVCEIMMFLDKNINNADSLGEKTRNALFSRLDEIYGTDYAAQYKTACDLRDLRF